MGSLTKFCDAMRWAADSDQVGYSQSDRWGVVFFGDGLYNADCSSLVIQAARYAGFETGDATYTGNMSAAFCDNGWTRLPVGVSLKAGDILLNDGNHVAAWIGDCIAQASIDENGNIAGGEPGDQPGNEVNTCPYYDYPWDCVLRYEESESEGFDMAEALFYIKGGNHEGYIAGDIVYFNSASGFKYLPHPDCVSVLGKMGDIAKIESRPDANWIHRASQCVQPAVREATYGKRV